MDWVPRFYCNVGASGGGLSARGAISGEMGLEGGITEFLGWSAGAGWCYSQKTAYTPDTHDGVVTSYVDYGRFDDAGIALYLTGSAIYRGVSLGVVAGWGQRSENVVVRGKVPPQYLYLNEIAFKDYLVLGATLRLRIPWDRRRICLEVFADTFRGFGVGIGVRY